MSSRFFSVSTVQIPQRRAAPQGERGREARGRAVRIALVQRPGRLGNQGLEALEIDVAARGPKPITVGLRLDSIGPDCPTQTGHMDAEGVVRAGRRIVAPDLLDEPVARDGLARVEDEHGQDRALARAADLD
jgi:hypothetical protein